MPTTLTLKNIPDTIYDRLKASAQANRRSLNSEVLVCLESALQPARPAAQRLDNARRLRDSLAPARFKARDIQLLKQQGRS